MEKRIEELLGAFRELFGEAKPVIYSAPGRTEIGGNHTDHQRGKVLAGSVDADIIAAAAENGSGTVRVKSEGYDMLQVDLGKLEPVEAEQGSTTALVRGICSEAVRRGYQVRRFASLSMGSSGET